MSDKTTRTPNRGMMDRARKKKREEREKDQTDESRKIKDHPFFRSIKPRKGFVFHSDYFRIDNSYATILSIFSHQGADDHLSYFWGIQLIPNGVDPDISVRRLEHVSRMRDSWITQHQGTAEGLLNNKANEVERDGSLTSRQKLSKEQDQLVEIAQDIMNGSSYLRVAIRLLVKAPSLERLDDAVTKINRQYKDRFDSLHAEPYTGEQRQEFENLYRPVDDKLGRNFMFTSAELAGNYSLVTRGIEDRNGEYIGQMEGDVNNSAVLMDLDDYDSHVVVAGRAEARTLSGWDFNGEKGVDVWGAKLGMNALLRNKRVVHLVLNRSKVADIGVDLSDVTSNVDMTQGDINPFEMFGDKKDELSIFPAHLEKMILMVEQLQSMGEGKEAARTASALRSVLNDFYVDMRMWSKNAQENRDALRLVGIPHNQVPNIPEFLSYLDMRYEEQKQAKAKDEQVMHGFGFLRDAFRDMLDSNGDLFNTTTSDVIDHAAVSSRVIYDFSSLIHRGRGVMMAQFVNALGFAVGQLGKGDVVILHGAGQLTQGVKQFVKDQFEQLNENGTRVVYIYNSVEGMIEDRSFNEFQRADYTLLGGMTSSTIELYEDVLKQDVPLPLKSLLEHREPYRYYLRRGFDNIVFANDIMMGFDI